GMGSGFNKQKLPFYENFTYNKVNGVRGFLPNFIGPKSIYAMSEIDKCIGYKKNGLCQSFNSVGGNSIFMSNLELITPIPFIDKEYSSVLRSSFFLDAGSIWNTNWDHLFMIKSLKSLDYSHINNLYASPGFSLKWISPIGPLVFSYSYPLQNNKIYQ
ncbi:BamA/TamA family outer membrane protein, partial [Buchnera aphidicola]|nr:BamA/TamA family outer membrane protein [Buchnera aphidicola]